MITVRRSGERFVTRSRGVQTRHCFSFGRHYDPDHVGHGPLLVHDEHLLEPGAGFASHPHRDVEVVSWVLEGALLHQDAAGSSVVPAGHLQRTTAGTGVRHAEHAGATPTRLVQLWLAASAEGLAPSYEQVPVPQGHGLLAVLPAVGSRGRLHLARLGAGEQAVLPEATYVHLYLVAGRALLSGTHDLHPGDSARLTEAGPVLLQAVEQLQALVVAAPQE